MTRHACTIDDLITTPERRGRYPIRSRNTITRLVETGELPRPFRLGQRVLFWEDELNDYDARRTEKAAS